MVSDWNGCISATTRPIATINTSIQRSIHCASNREKRDEKALQTSEIHCKTWRKASCRLSKTKRDRSRSVEQLRSSFFLEWKGFFFLVTSSIEFKAIRVTTTIGNACSLRDAGPRSRIDRKSERFSLSWWTLNECYSSSSRRIFTNEVSPFRCGKDLSIGTFLFKIRAKMTPQRCSKAIDDYPSKFDWPGIKGLNISSSFIIFFSVKDAADKTGPERLKDQVSMYVGERGLNLLVNGDALQPWRQDGSTTRDQLMSDQFAVNSSSPYSVTKVIAVKLSKLVETLRTWQFSWKKVAKEAQMWMLSCCLKLTFLFGLCFFFFFGFR